MSDQHYLVVEHQHGGTLMSIEHPESCQADQLACPVSLATASYGSLQAAFGPDAASEDLPDGRYTIDVNEGALSLNPA